MLNPPEKIKCKYCAESFTKNSFVKHIKDCKNTHMSPKQRRLEQKRIAKLRPNRIRKPIEASENREPHFVQGGSPSLSKRKR